MQILTRDQLRTLCPSVFATRPYDGLSDRYRFVSTIDVIERMEGHGFLPVRASQSRCRIEGKRPFTKHMIRLRHVADMGGEVGEETPELVLVNSHDRTSAYRLFAGVFRLICSNGAVIQSADFGGFSIRHSGGSGFYNQLEDATGRIMEEMPVIMRRIDEWKGISLSRLEQLELAAKAWDLKPNQAVTLDALLNHRRPEDAPGHEMRRDLWRSYNVIEENLFKGGLSGVNQRGRRIRTRPIKAVTADLNIHRQLWSVAESFASPTN